jgi:hypothetical protein
MNPLLSVSTASITASTSWIARASPMRPTSPSINSCRESFPSEFLSKELNVFRCSACSSEEMIYVVMKDITACWSLYSAWNIFNCRKDVSITSSGNPGLFTCLASQGDSSASSALHLYRGSFTRSFYTNCFASTLITPHYWGGNGG